MYHDPMLFLIVFNSFVGMFKIFDIILSSESIVSRFFVSALLIAPIEGAVIRYIIVNISL